MLNSCICGQDGFSTSFSGPRWREAWTRGGGQRTDGQGRRRRRWGGWGLSGVGFHIHGGGGAAVTAAERGARYPSCLRSKVALFRPQPSSLSQDQREGGEAVVCINENAGTSSINHPSFSTAINKLAFHCNLQVYDKKKKKGKCFKCSPLEPEQS